MFFVKIFTLLLHFQILKTQSSFLKMCTSSTMDSTYSMLMIEHLIKFYNACALNFLNWKSINRKMNRIDAENIFMLWKVPKKIISYNAICDLISCASNQTFRFNRFVKVDKSWMLYTLSMNYAFELRAYSNCIRFDNLLLSFGAHALFTSKIVIYDYLCKIFIIHAVLSLANHKLWPESINVC